MTTGQADLVLRRRSSDRNCNTRTRFHLTLVEFTNRRQYAARLNSRQSTAVARGLLLSAAVWFRYAPLVECGRKVTSTPLRDSAIGGFLGKALIHSERRTQFRMCQADEGMPYFTANPLDVTAGGVLPVGSRV